MIAPASPTGTPYQNQSNGNVAALTGPLIPAGPGGEHTMAQVLVGTGPDGLLPPGALTLNAATSQAGWLRKVRLMRRDATLGFLRDVYMAPILVSEWTVTTEHQEFDAARKEIEDSFVNLRVQFLRDALRGFMDFGWQPYEMVQELDEDTGHFRVTKMKGLLQDLTTIVVDYYGGMLGVRNSAIANVKNPNPVYLFRGNSVVLYRDAEGTNWYSEPLMRRCERAFDSWGECDDAARRFDVKVAGAHWVVYYPVGTSKLNGMMTDNADIAQAILDALYSSGKVAIPQAVSKFVEDVNSVGPEKQLWRVELLSANTQQSFFVDRLKYIDSLKARGMGIPERAIFEGQFGTKAESEAHADFAIDNIEMTHREILALLNKQAVDYLLEVNWGPKYRGKVKIECTPLSDAKKAFLRQLFTTHFATPEGQAMRGDRIDWDGIQDELGIPQVKNTGGAQDATARPGDARNGARPLLGQHTASRRQRYLSGTHGGRGA